jgi:hypothetical protein
VEDQALRMRVRECMEKEIAPMMTEVLCLDFGGKKNYV